MDNTKIVKRYRNRKLYDVESSGYVTLKDLADWVREDKDVSVLDNNDQRDITATTLTQIIIELQKATEFAIPISTLKQIIREFNGSLGNYLAQVSSETHLKTIKVLESQVKSLAARLEMAERESDFSGPKDAAFEGKKQLVVV